MLRDLFAVLSVAALVVGAAAGLILAVTVGVLFLPSVNGPAAIAVACAWAILTAGILGVGALFILSWVFSRRTATHPAVVTGVLEVGVPLRRAPGRCLVCRTAGVRQSLVCCARCLAPHHEDCWRYAGKCAVFGCGGTRPLTASRP